MENEENIIANQDYKEKNVKRYEKEKLGVLSWLTIICFALAAIVPFTQEYIKYFCIYFKININFDKLYVYSLIIYIIGFIIGLINLLTRGNKRHPKTIFIAYICIPIVLVLTALLFSLAIWLLFFLIFGPLMFGTPG